MVNILKVKSDRRTLAGLIVAISVQIFCIVNFSLNWTALPYLLIFAVAGFWASTANHMHQHLSIFHSDLLNQALNLILSVMFGAPATRLHIVHLWNHHAHFNADDFESSDWSHHNLAGSSRGIFRAMKYVAAASVLMAKNRSQINVPAASQKSLVRERFFLWLVAAVLIYQLPYVFFMLILPGWLLSLSLLLTANLINHDYCQTNSDLHHSRDFLNRAENFLFLNSGYHSAHHRLPAKHWSDLPHVHLTHFKDKKIQIEHSFFLYFLQNYFFSTRKGQNESGV